MTTNDKKSNKKRIIAWFCLIVLMTCLLTLNYIKFFQTPNKNIEERPINNSSEQAVQTALEDIVRNFNNSQELKEYSSQNIKMKATLNQHSIYISYTTDTTITYEFSYNNLILSINVENNEENMKKFNQVYSILLKAIQKRINNTENNIDDIINKIVNEDIIYDGITKEKIDGTYFFQIDITKKLNENNTETTVENNIENTEKNNEDNQENNNETE